MPIARPAVPGQLVAVPQQISEFLKVDGIAHTGPITPSTHAKKPRSPETTGLLSGNEFRVETPPARELVYAGGVLSRGNAGSRQGGGRPVR